MMRIPWWAIAVINGCGGCTKILEETDYNNMRSRMIMLMHIVGNDACELQFGRLRDENMYLFLFSLFFFFSFFKVPYD